MPLPRVAIAVPSGTTVHAGFAMALANLCAVSRDLPLQLSSVRSSIIAIARNNAVEEARVFGADYLLFLDSDMEFPPTALLRLLLHNRDIVGATYVRRVSPAKIIGRAAPLQPVSAPKGLIAMERIPTGCLLIRMNVFAALEKPYFRFGINEQRDIVGEDFQFCDAARSAGFDIWCDARLTGEMVHLGEHAFRLDDIGAGAVEAALDVPLAEDLLVA